jgi:hypothetical protein
MREDEDARRGLLKFEIKEHLLGSTLSGARRNSCQGSRRRHRACLYCVVREPMVVVKAHSKQPVKAALEALDSDGATREGLLV